MDLSGRCALITGAASGLGWATTAAFVAAGANVVMFDLNEDALMLKSRRLGAVVKIAAGDVRRSEDVADAISTAISTFGALDVAINCAGVPSSKKTVSRGEAHDLLSWDRVIGVNLTGTFNVMRLVAAAMIENRPDAVTGERGVIINTSSVAAFDGQKGQVAYAASKAAVAGMTLPVARDLADKAIRCVAIAPGLFETELFAEISEKGIEALKSGLLYPPRMGHASEFAALARQIVENPYLNGTTIRLDGGTRLP